MPDPRKIALADVVGPLDAADAAGKASARAALGAEAFSALTPISAASTNLVSSHNRGRLRFSHATPTLTIQANASHAYPDHFIIAGQSVNDLTITAAAGVTLNGDLAGSFAVGSENDATGFTLSRTSSNTWNVFAGQAPTIESVTGLQDALDAKAPTVHVHEIADITSLQTLLEEMAQEIAILRNGGTIGQFLSNGWTLVTGSGPGELLVTIVTPPTSSVAITHIIYKIDDVDVSVPIASTIVIQTGVAGASETVQIAGASGEGPGRIVGEFSEGKTATSGAATVPAAFAAGDWNFTGGAGPEAGVIEILGLPAANGAAISGIKYQADGGAWVSLSGFAIGTYPIALAGLSGDVDMHLRAVNSVGDGAITAVAKTATVPGADTAPATFADNQWDFQPGDLPGSYALNIIALPGDGGSALTLLEYTLDDGATWPDLTGTGTGVRQLTGFAPGLSGTARVRAVNAVNPGTQSGPKTATSTAGSLVAGGTKTMVGAERRHTLTASGNVTVYGDSQSVKWELVAPGGSGGNGRGGGGGAGQIRRWNDPGETELVLTAGTWAYVHGAPGMAPAVANTNGNPGGNSSFGGITALGGGAGAGAVGSPGGSGGSGGGGRGGETGNSSAGGADGGVNASAGGAGYTSSDTSFQTGGGGGGAGGAGSAGLQNAGGVGGAGSASIAPGVTAIYSGGGGGARNLTTANGGHGGDTSTTGGRGAGGTTSGNTAEAGHTPGSGGGGGLGATRYAGSGAAGLLHIWYTPAAATLAPADVIVGNAAQLTTALAAAPSNTGARYIIGLTAGFSGGNFEVTANYNKGTTLVQIRSQSTTTPALFNTFRAANPRNIELEGLNIWNTNLDDFGFGSGVTVSFEGARGTGAHRCAIRNCDIRGGSEGIRTAGNKYCDYSHNSIRGAAIDQLRLANNNSTQSQQSIRVNNNHISALHPTRSHPNLTAQVGYSNLLSDATDPRRSDQVGGDTLVRNLAGVNVLVTAATKANRHPDLIQGWGLWDDVVIEDNYLETGDAYRHGIFYQNAVAQNPEYATGVTIRRNHIIGAHVHGIALVRVIDPVVQDNLIRQRAGVVWAQHYWSGTPTPAERAAVMVPSLTNRNLDLEGRYPATRVQFNNNVLPAAATAGTYWTRSGWLTGTGNVYSDSAEPTGWSGFDAANNRFGPYGYDN